MTPPHFGRRELSREREQLTIVGQAVAELERRGCTVDGQVAATRSAERMIAKVARVRRVRYVVMDAQPTGGVRQLIESSVAGIVRRRLADRAALELVGRS